MVVVAFCYCQDELKRFNIYPRGSVLHLHASCYNSAVVEKRILERFNKRFRNEAVYGKEYFHGDLLQMLAIVCEEIGLSFHCTDSSQDYFRSLLKVKNEAERSAALQERRYKALEKDNERLNKLVTNLKGQIRAIVSDENEDVESSSDIEDVSSDTSDDEEHFDDDIVDDKRCSPPLEKYKKHRFQCVKCNKVLSSKRQLGYHQAKCTGLHPLQCPICFKRFASVAGKSQHKRFVKCQPPPPPLEEERHRFQCVKCNKVLSSKRQLGYHQAKCNGLLPRQCPTCLKVFSTRQGKYEHIKFVKCQPPENNSNIGLTSTTNQIESS